jgi:hypothetical protein
MPQWKQFGDVILNLDRVVKVERRGDAVKVYMAGLLPATQGSGLGAADATPGARTFGGDEARRVWEYFHGLIPPADRDGAGSASGARPASAPTMHTVMPVVRPTAPAPAPAARPPATSSGAS